MSLHYIFSRMICLKMNLRLLYFQILLILLLLQRIGGLKCFAGDPIYQHECTSLSYCLFIISRSGRSQWSCDGNSFSQVSLCSTLGLMDNLLIGNDAGHSHSIGPIAIFEQSPSPTPIPQNHDRLTNAGDEEAMAEYYRKQEASVLNSLMAGNTDNRRRFYFTDNQNQLANRRSLSGGIRYYTGQSRCFDGGDLGRICCCSTDFCNQTLSTHTTSKLLVFLLAFCAIFFRLYRI